MREGQFIKNIRLQTRIVVLIILFFSVTTLAVLYFVSDMARANTLREAEEKAKIILQRNLATHRYFTEKLKPALFELTESLRDQDYFDPIWMSSTFAIREIDNFYKEASDEEYYYKECAVNARSTQNEADEVERVFLKMLNDDPSLEMKSTIREIDGKPYFTTIYRGEVLSESCMMCHSESKNAPSGMVKLYGPVRSFNRSIGDTVSAVSIRVPLEKAYASGYRLLLATLALVGVAFVFLLFVVILMNRKLVLSPLERLGAYAEKVSMDPDVSDEEISELGSPEFRHMSKAFGRMLGDLKQHRENLEQLVRERTQELEEELEARRRAEDVNIRYERQLQEMKRQESLGLLAGGVAHDFNNLLTSIMGNINLALMDLPTESEVAEYMRETIKAAERASDLTHQMLAYSGKGYFILEPLNLSKLIPYVKATFNFNLSVDIEWLLEVDENIIIEASKSQIITVLKNLLTNSAEAIVGEGGKITISTGTVKCSQEYLAAKLPLSALPEGTYVFLEVSDNGSGMEKDTLAKIFDPFFSTKFTGRGLGLATVQGIVKGHGGEIIVSSEPWKGTSFRILFPQFES